MTEHRDPIVVLAVEDDPDDRLMIGEAFEENKLANELHFAEDGEIMLDYLYQRGPFTAETAPRPGLILLDLNLPKKDGREALKEIKEDPKLRSIPVVVLTTSKAEEDILRTYNLGVSGFIVKPVTFEDLATIVSKLGDYWFRIVQLPPKHIA